MGVVSSGGVGTHWLHQPQVVDASCNHLSYFTDPAGIGAIRMALRA